MSMQSPREWASFTDSRHPAMSRPCQVLRPEDCYSLHSFLKGGKPTVISGSKKGAFIVERDGRQLLPYIYLDIYVM